MKRPIKFRGRDTADGVRDTVTFTLDELLATSDDYGLVDPDSVAQLVGYDANGYEVYEGDKLTDEYDIEFIANLLPRAVTVKAKRPFKMDNPDHELFLDWEATS